MRHCFAVNYLNEKENMMKKLAAVLFVLFAVVSNVSFANDDCHPDEDHKDHCEHH